MAEQCLEHQAIGREPFYVLTDMYPMGYDFVERGLWLKLNITGMNMGSPFLRNGLLRLKTSMRGRCRFEIGSLDVGEFWGLQAPSQRAS